MSESVVFEDLDQYIREAGVEAMAEIIERAVPLRAALVAMTWLDGPADPRCGEKVQTNERALLDLAAWCIQTVVKVRRGEMREIESASAALEREVIAVAARGVVAHARLEVLEVEAFTSAPRLFAWVAASIACRQLGRRASFAAARHLLVTCAAFDAGGRCELPRAVAIELFVEAQEELDLAEEIARPSSAAIGRLLAQQRATQARAWLAPVVEAIDRGVPLVDSAARMRTAADVFEGRT